jgi:dimethylargininase
LFRSAIVRIPGSNFAEGLTTGAAGVPDYGIAVRQHSRYREVLEECGLALTTLDADLRYPDSTFVEDIAVLTPSSAILTRPGAPSRRGEVAAIRETICNFFPAPLEIEAPGTLDGGDVCEADHHFFLGLSQRSNEEGVRQLAKHLAAQGYTSSVIDVRGVNGILHLKSAISYIGNNTIVATKEMAGNELYRNYELIRVSPRESYAANCVRVNDRVLVAGGYPEITAELDGRGFQPLMLDMSEFQKMDGGLSCLSLRF